MLWSVYVLEACVCRWPDFSKWDLCIKKIHTPTYYMNKIKDTNMIISIDAEKAFDKIQH